MLQRKSFVVFLLCAIFAGCSDPNSPPASQPASRPTTTPAAGTVVSLSPAATDLLLAMGIADRLVGVSTYDNDPRIASLPRVGDYENVDWERIATLSPKLMVVQMAPERLPPAFRERAQHLGITLYSAHIDRLDDITREVRSLGEAVGEPTKADSLVKSIQTPIDEARQRTKDAAKVRTLICVSDDGLGVAGRDEYLDDLLIAAGGENVLDASRGRYVHLDREAILALSPDAIILLSPSPSDAQRQTRNQALAGLDNLPAVKNGRVLVIEDPWALTPGAHVGELADRFARFLHP